VNYGISVSMNPTMVWVCARLGVKHNRLFEYLRASRVLKSGPDQGPAATWNTPFATYGPTSTSKRPSPTTGSW